MEEYVIGPAHLSDIDSLLEIENACFGGDAFSRRQFTYLINRSKGFFYVVKESGRTVAYLCLLHNQRAGSLRIYSIAVHPEMRGRGIAQLLMDKCFECKRQVGAHTLRLEVNVNNPAAIELYKKNGLEICDLITGYYADGSNAFVMRIKN